MSLGSNSKRKVIVFVTVLAGWVILVGFGLRMLLLYAQTPGHLASPPSNWPMDSPVRLARGRMSLLIFTHPKYPCSCASLGELALILARCHNQVEATVFVYRSQTAPRDWEKTDIWQTAAMIPGVRVLADSEAAAARRFGAHVSGQVLLYDADEHLVFNGGITAFRGHAGDNDGRDAVVAILRNESPQHRTTPVFGCALYGEE